VEKTEEANMARAIVGHHPELTPDSVMEVFKRHFGGKYEIYKTRMLGAHFVVRKSGWKAVTIRLMQRRKRTILVYNASPGSAVIRTSIFLVWLVGIVAVIGGPGMPTTIYASAGRYVVVVLWTLLLIWARAVPGRGLEREVKALIRQADEFK
jgi:hypothetical protein